MRSYLSTLHVDCRRYCWRILNMLKLQGPSDGVCNVGHKWIHIGADFGFDYNVCCCMPVPPYEQCDATDPRICPMTPPYKRNDTLGGYFKMVGEAFKDFAPEDGCCDEQFLDTRSVGFNFFVEKQTLNMWASVSTLCSHIKETMEEVIINLIESNGPGDGIYQSGYKWTKTVDYLGSQHKICCCVDTTPFETCDVSDPRVCLLGLFSLPGELIGDFWNRTVAKLKDTAP